MSMDDAVQTFIVESGELLQDMETCLLRIETEADQTESINAIFRAAHTIKGSAGLFGFDAVVEFTHVAESVLDKVRNGELPIDADLVALLLLCGDHIAKLIDQVLAPGGELSADVKVDGEALVDKLSAYLGKKPKAVAMPAAAESASAKVHASGGGVLDNDNWHISLRFGADVLRSGMDPLSFFRFLETIGKIVTMTTLFDAMPPAADMDPESCYMGYEVSFQSDADKAEIEGVFEFVREDCQLHILPPHSRMVDFLEFIADLPEENMLLGEILVRCGTLTQAELEQALSDQSHEPGAPSQLGEMIVEKGLVQPEIVEAALEKQKQVKDTKAKQQQLVRVDAEKLDQLINLIGELVIASAGASMMSQRSAVPELIEMASELERLVEEVRDSALNLRMVQIGDTFNRFQRVVRDVSKELGKQIELEISGGETELDKTVVEKIGDPLTHLIRNSMDHGIEKGDVRLARGKPEHGTVSLNAYHESGSIVIEVSDDGGGLNRDKILSKAIEKGIVQPGQALSDDEIHKLIFEAGFSTADQLSNISGRGVGMDVVRSNIESLRGSIEIDTELGVGTTMRIRLPLTLAIIDGFLVGVGKASFVIPLDMVVECVDLMEEDRLVLQDRGYINLRGEVLPCLRLRDKFEITGNRVRRENVVVAQYGAMRAGLVVDALQGEFQTVIKPLGKLFEHIRGISGSTILGSGEVALILDVPALVQSHRQRD